MLCSHLRSWLWRVYSTRDKAIEGWLITFVYGPIMSILLEILDTILKMTEYKVVDKSLAHPLLLLIDEEGDKKKKEYRHDAVLHVQDLEIDVMIVEAKPNRKGSDADIDKLGLVLSDMLLGIRDGFPKIKVGDLRVHGMMIIGYRTMLIEAQ
jgi:hypothetical protein